MNDNDRAIYERLARIEERALNRDEKLDDIADKVNKLYEKSKEQEGMLKAGRLTVGAIGALGGAAITLLFKILPFTHNLPK